MNNKLDLTNNNYGKWKVLEISGKTAANKIIWKCQCECGCIRNIVASKIIKFTKDVKCQKCTNSERKIKSNCEINYFTYIKPKAIKRNIDFDLECNKTLDLLKQQKNMCYLSGINISIKDHTASLDRIDSSKGYVKENIGWTHKHINLMKHLLSVDRLIENCEMVSKFDGIFPIFNRSLEVNTHGGFNGYYELSSTFYYNIKIWASRRKLKFNLSMQDIWNKYISQGGLCALSGQVIKFEPIYNKNRNIQNASIDRIDSYRHYDLDNFQIVHKDINFMKRDFSQDYFIDLCRKVYLWNIRNGNI